MIEVMSEISEADSSEEDQSNRSEQVLSDQVSAGSQRARASQREVV